MRVRLFGRSECLAEVAGWLGDIDQWTVDAGVRSEGEGREGRRAGLAWLEEGSGWRRAQDVLGACRITAKGPEAGVRVCYVRSGQAEAPRPGRPGPHQGPTVAVRFKGAVLVSWCW